ncbi:folylpolyglutamate synthase, mitochondrial-like isoform X2 [Mytilus californianus]|uniref:folylpolyglutamate synthase, mitochondrial-like isoform X2 n=1 Tax=Mytilus californianus TaxID=6549 RepID=UPI00224754A6|nr:folylpolyglutamate synthase, mitochondrial-like isoform X2 [Mytilus californianus]
MPSFICSLIRYASRNRYKNPSVMSPLVKTCVPFATKLTKKLDLNQKYEECVKTLNTLQSNAQTLEKTRLTRDKLAPLHVPNMVKWASSVGITLDDIDRLKVIHVSGTKGKGSTCAYCESILRHQGFKTGFFSSPHLVEVRERFQINGQPLSREKFVTYFWDVFNKLEATKEQNNDSMPAYFAFLTLMAYNIFLKEQTDVAIIEVGIGGEYDSTNLVRKPVVCGVTSLGMDHVSILGNTIEKIAWQKAGIFKPGVPAFTSPQCPEALKVLHERAEEKGCHLEVAPHFASYERPGEKFKLGIAGHMQKVNASLALQLTRTWMKTQGVLKEEVLNGVNEVAVDGHGDIGVAKSFPFNQTLINGLVECKWLGRNQTIKKNRLTYYLDGAHTLESIQQCVDWFQKHSKREADSMSGKVIKILLFNTTGDRDVTQLLRPLMSCGFDGAVFCPNISYTTSSSADITNMTVSNETQLQKCQHNMETWKMLSLSKRKYGEIEEVTEVDSQPGSYSSPLKNGVHTNTENNCLNGTSSLKKSRLTENCNNSNLSSGLVDNSQSHDNIDQSKQNSYTASTSSCTDSLGLGTPKQLGTNCNNFFVNFSCIYDALLWASHGRDQNLKDPCNLPAQIQEADHVQVLVTGSIHLVGGVLGIVSDDYN